MNIGATAKWAAVGIAGGMAAGALGALVTPTKDEALQTKLTAAVAGIGAVGGGLLLAASGRMHDGGVAAAVLGAFGVAGGVTFGGAALGSLLVDSQN